MPSAAERREPIAHCVSRGYPRVPRKKSPACPLLSERFQYIPRFFLAVEGARAILIRMTTHTALRTEPARTPSTQDSPDYLLSLYIDERLTIADIAFTLNISISETLARLAAPEFLRLLENYTAAQERRSAALIRSYRVVAARNLAKLAESADKPETARKAAVELIRMQKNDDPSPQVITPDQRIRAVATYSRTPTADVRDLLSPILGPPLTRQAA